MMLKPLYKRSRLARMMMWVMMAYMVAPQFIPRWGRAMAAEAAAPAVAAPAAPAAAAVAPKSGLPVGQVTPKTAGDFHET